MKTLEKVSDFVGKYMAAIVIVVAALSLLFPGTFSVVKTAWVNTLLGIVMFGMGLTLKPEDFKVVFSRPKDVIIGCIAQFTLMPFLAWALTQLFHLPTELAIGVILVGTCPGGTSSNVMTYLSKGDVALSVGMTAVSTVLAPILTPLLTLLYAGQRVDVNPVNMFLSIVKVVLVPIALGFVVNHFFHAFTQNAIRVLPLVSTTAIVLIICAVVSANSAKIMTSGLLILAVVILHNLLGYLTGFGVGKLLKLDSTKCRAISIEVGMQNSGLATSLAAAHFAQYPLATIPGAVFSVWHNISGAVLANFFARTAEKKDTNKKKKLFSCFFFFPPPLLFFFFLLRGGFFFFFLFSPFFPQKKPPQAKRPPTPPPPCGGWGEFFFFKKRIFKIKGIFYRSATNGSFHSPQSRTNSEVISSNLLLNISPYCSYPTNTELSTSQIWFRPIACTASIAASLWLKCRFPTVRQFAPSSVVILLERSIKVHQVMQTDRLIRLIVHQQAPVFPMAVSVAHQIIQNVHHIVSVSIQFQNFIQRIPITVCAVDIIGCIRHKAIPL